MGIIYSNDFIEASAITARSVDSGPPAFAAENVQDYWHLKRRLRLDEADKSNINPILRIDIGAAKTVEAVFLNDINFDTVLILGHASDLTTDWTAADFTSGIVSVSHDPLVGRYKIYVPLTAFNYRWIAICVPTTASAVGPYQTKWEVGTVVLLDTVTELSKNMSYGYERGPKQDTVDTGSHSSVATSEVYWEGTAKFKTRSVAQEAEVLALGKISMEDPMIFYENNGDTSKCYLCRRLYDYSGSQDAYNLVNGGPISFREIVKR